MKENKVITFGCRLNIFESEVIKDQLKKSNQENTIIFNSCAVTSETERKVRQSIRKHKKQFPEKKIIVTGCAAQINPQLYSNMSEVDMVLGNKEKLELKQHLFSSNNTENIQVSDIMELKETSSHMVTSFEGKARAFLEIQNGCNHRCTFCIIPFGRGNNRSVPIPTIIKNCQRILDEGFLEIVLTGVDITDYGTNLPVKPSFAYLIKEILKHCPNLTRLRLSSLDVAEIDDDLRNLLVTEKRILPHFHISMQSGDNMILKRMKRRHNREQIIDFCNFIKKHRKNSSIGADIITGFPTETEEMFLNSVQLVKNLQISLLHIFPYSEREGTPAAKIPQEKQIAKNIRKERARILINLGKENLRKFQKEFIGKKIDALVESKDFLRSDQFLKIKLKNSFKSGTVVKVKIIGSKEGYLLAQDNDK